MARIVKGIEEAKKIAALYTAKRSDEIGILEAYVKGTQYEGLPNWFDADKPIQDRGPCFVYPIAASAIASNVDLILGEGRFPLITSAPGEDEADVGGMSREDSAQLDRLIVEIVRECRFKLIARDALRVAQGSRSSVVIFCLRRGILRADLLPVRWCTPEFSPINDLISLTIEYPYLTETQTPDGSWFCECKIYKRIIDEHRDVTFLPAKGMEDGRQPVFTEDKKRTYDHGLGFCPVVWYSHMGIHGDTPTSFDGAAIHEFLLDEITALDMSISQRQRAALYTGDPQPYEIGVEPGSNPSSTGRQPSIPSTARGGIPSSANPTTGRYINIAQGEGARRKGPHITWQYENPETKVGLLTLPAGALDGISDHANDIRTKIAESLAVVFLDPEHIKFAASLSGKSLELLRERQINRCDSLREDFGQRWVISSIQMCLRILWVKKDGARLCAEVPDTLKILQHVASICEKYGWDANVLRLVWGRYFKSDEDEELKTVTAVKHAFGTGLITRRAAVEKLRGIFPISSVAAALETLAREGADPKLTADAIASIVALSIPSETFQRESRKQAALALLSGADKTLLDKIVSEIDKASAEELVMVMPMEGGGGGKDPKDPAKQRAQDFKHDVGEDGKMNTLTPRVLE